MQDRHTRCAARATSASQSSTAGRAPRAYLFFACFLKILFSSLSSCQKVFFVFFCSKFKQRSLSGVQMSWFGGAKPAAPEGAAPVPDGPPSAAAVAGAGPAAAKKESVSQCVDHPVPDSASTAFSRTPATHARAAARARHLPDHALRTFSACPAARSPAAGGPQRSCSTCCA